MQEAKQYYVNNQTKDEQAMTSKEMYKHTLGECVHDLDRHSDERRIAVSHDLDKDIARNLKARGHSYENTRDAIRDHSPEAAKYHGKDREDYAAVTAHEVYMPKEQAQNYRPENSKFQTWDAKTPQSEIESKKYMQMMQERNRDRER